MSDSKPISERGLEQLQSMAEIREQMGQATVLEKALPELVAEVYSLREQSAKTEHKVAAAIEDLHNIAAQASGEDDAVTRMAARARQRLRGELGPGPEPEPDTEHAALPTEADLLLHSREELQRVQAERCVAIELINDEDLTSEFVHRLDSAGLLEHPVNGVATEPSGDDNDSGSDAVLHLYPLAHEHGDAMTSGNPEGLRILKNRLEKALASAAGGDHYIDYGYADGPEMQLFAADGEGYDLSVECRPGSCHDPDWEERPMPYYVSRRGAREAGMDA